RRDETGEAPEIEVRTVDPLHGQPERSGLTRGGVDLDRFQMLDETWAAVPRRIFAAAADVVAGKARDGDCREARDADLAGERPVIEQDAVEDRLIVADEVHLVDGEHEVADAEQVREIRMAPCLREHALARIDED